MSLGSTPVSPELVEGPFCLSGGSQEEPGFDGLSPNGEWTMRSDKRVLDVRCDEASLIVDLMNGRTISAPLAWYPRLLQATPDQRAVWEKAGGGYGIHWPEIDKDLSTEGLLRGAPAAAKAA